MSFQEDEQHLPEDLPKVFLSYSRKDRERAQRIAEVLRARSFGVFRDTDDILPTEEWRGRLEELIAEADTIVFLLSPHSASSEVCAWEVTYAASLNKRIAPIVIDDVDTGDIPPLLSRLNFIFATDRDPFENAVDTLVSALNTDIEWIREHTRLAGLARRWHLADRPDRLLLRGQDIADAEAWRDTRPDDAPVVSSLQAAFLAASRQGATRRQRMTILASLVALVVALSLAGLAYWQRQEAIESEAQAVANAKRAESERNQALIGQSRFLADLARQKTESGDAGSGALLALNGLSDRTIDRERPYVAEAERALYAALQLRRERAVLEGHRGHVTSLAFSRDGRRLASGSLTGMVAGQPPSRIRLWDVERGVQTKTLATSAQSVGALAFAAGDTRLVSTHDARPGRLWNTESGAPVKTFYGAVRARALALSPDGTRMVTSGLANASDRASARISDTGTGEEIAKIVGPIGAALRADWSPDGKRLAVGSFGKTLIWDIENKAPIAVLDGDSQWNPEVAYSPDGTLIATSGKDGETVLWKAGKGEKLSTLISSVGNGPAGFEKRISKIRFSPDGSRLATLNEAGSLVLWDAMRGLEIATMGTFSPQPDRGAAAAIREVTFSHDGKWLAAGTGAGEITFWTADRGLLFNTFSGHSQDVLALAISPDGKTLASGSADGTVRLWSLEPGLGRRLLRTDGHGVTDIAFSADGTRLAAGSSAGTTHHWNVQTEAPATTHKVHSDTVSKVVFARRGHLLATGSHDGSVALWNGADGQHILSFPDHGSGVTGLAISPDGTLVAASGGGATGGPVKVYDVAARRRLATLSGPTGEPGEPRIAKLAFSADGKMLAAAVAAGSVHVWDVGTWDKVRVLSGHDKGVNDIAFSPDGLVIASASYDRTARLWNAATGQAVATIEAGGSLERVMFSPRGATLATAHDACHYKCWKIWNVESGTLLAELDGLTGGVVSGAFSPDGTRFATGAHDGAIRVWDLARNATVARLNAGSAVNDLAYSPDGSWLAGATSGGTVLLARVFDTADALVTHAKRLVQRCLDPDERRAAYLPSAPPRWCVTGAELETEKDPSAWQPKWPYQSQAWRDWLVALDDGSQPPMPEDWSQ